MITLNEYLTKNKTADCTYMSKRVELNSGLTLSIQASEYHYCEPRKNIDDKSRYSMFEIGFPSAEIELISHLAEDPSDLTGTVYPYVPREVVETVISDNGGIKGAVKND